MQTASEEPTTLRDQVVIITGAGRGFGRVVAERLVAGGASVCLTQRSRQELGDAARALPGDRVISVTGDVTRSEDVQRVVAETEKRLGPVTLLVNSAGIHGPLGPVWEVDAEAWWQTQAVHLRGAFLYTNAVMPGMIRRKAGRIITIASNVGLKASGNFSAYAVAKASQIRLMESVHLEGRPHGIAAFALAPETAITDLNRSIMESPDAQRWMPRLVEHLRRIDREADAETALQRCGVVCARIAAGRYDSLSGRYLHASWDLDAMSRKSLLGRAVNRLKNALKA